MTRNHKPPARTYTEEEITNGLAALAYFNGSATAAARELRRRGAPIPKQTLHRWKQLYADRYLEVQTKFRQQVWGRISDDWRRVAEDGVKVTGEALEKGHEATVAGNSKQASEWGSAVRNYATAAGISSDKARVIDGEPTEVRRETMDMATALRGIVKYMPHVKETPLYKAYVDSTAEEIPTREVVTVRSRNGDDDSTPTLRGSVSPPKGKGVDSEGEGG